LHNSPGSNTTDFFDRGRYLSYITSGTLNLEGDAAISSVSRLANGVSLEAEGKLKTSSIVIHKALLV